MTGLRRDVSRGHTLILERKSVLVKTVTFACSPNDVRFLNMRSRCQGHKLRGLFLSTLLRACLPKRRVDAAAFQRRSGTSAKRQSVLLRLNFTRGRLLARFNCPARHFILPPGGRRSVRRK